jgi:hypothetical protein
LCCFNNFVDHGVRRGNVARALAQWRHLVASHEATNTLHRVMPIAPYCPGSMAIEIFIDLPAFFDMIDSMFAHNVS